jgi:hypothetical protein
MRNGRIWFEWLLGLLIGLTLGLGISWWIAPNSRTDPSPAALRADFKDEYRLLIANSYALSGDLGRASTRLALLQDTSPSVALLDLALRLRSSQTHSIIFPDTNTRSANALDLLADAIQQTGLPATMPASETNTPAMPAPTTAVAPFELLSQTDICDPQANDQLAALETRDPSGRDLPGIEIIILWGNDRQKLVTGFKPSQGLGYADFVMTPGIEYSVQVLPSSAPVTGITAPECTAEDGTTYIGGIMLIFQQP